MKAEQYQPLEVINQVVLLGYGLLAAKTARANPRGVMRTLSSAWHRFNPDSALHPLIRTMAHPAFKVDEVNRAISGCRLLLAPYKPIAGFRVAIIEDGGVPIELIQTNLTDEEIWNRAKAGGQTAP